MNEATTILTRAATAPATLFANLGGGEDVAVNRLALFRALGSCVPGAYAVSLEAVDPNDPTNRKSIEPKMLTTLVRGGFINAQRGLDDDTIPAAAFAELFVQHQEQLRTSCESKVPAILESCRGKYARGTA